jgi:hypothetical protein
MGLARFSMPFLFTIILFFLNGLYGIGFTWVLLNVSPLLIDAVRRVCHIATSNMLCKKGKTIKNKKKPGLPLPTIMVVK